MNSYRINEITTENSLKTQNYHCLLCPHCHKDNLCISTIRNEYLYQLHQQRVSLGHKPNHLDEINLIHHFHWENSR